VYFIRALVNKSEIALPAAVINSGFSSTGARVKKQFEFINGEPLQAKNLFLKDLIPL
jgi:hypothetical protein